MIVHMYVIQDDAAALVTAITVVKQFLTASTAHSFVAVDDAGTPSSSITG